MTLLPPRPANRVNFRLDLLVTQLGLRTAQAILLRQLDVEALREQGIEQGAAFVRRQLPGKLDELLHRNRDL